MKLIYNRKQTEWVKELICTGCGVELLVEHKDLFRTYSGYRYYITFKCCECDINTDVRNYPYSINDLPKYKDCKK